MVTTVVYLKVEIDGDSPADPAEVAELASDGLYDALTDWHGMTVELVNHMDPRA